SQAPLQLRRHAAGLVGATGAVEGQAERIESAGRFRAGAGGGLPEQGNGRFRLSGFEVQLGAQLEGVPVVRLLAEHAVQNLHGLAGAPLAVVGARQEMPQSEVVRLSLEAAAPSCSASA